jgi:lysophospholipase L1-like esterase
MNLLQKVILLFITAVLPQNYTSQNSVNKDLYTVKGRAEITEDKSVVLIGSASSVTFGCKEGKCTISLKAADTYIHHNYVVIEIDGKYYSRNKVQPQLTTIRLDIPSGNHVITVYKATEASNGTVVFLGAEGNIFNVTQKPKKKIEFIGDSITCGMGNDTIAMPCGTGEWYDQHNAYYSYASIAARAVDADFVLSSVSGIGMYRHWNDEHDKEAIMPEVYENLYLNKNTSKPYAFGYNQDVTCIALGTNDFSEGDGKKARLPFNEDKYVSNYISFIQTVYKHAPNTRIILLNSPMVTGDKAKIFIKCLNRIKNSVNKNKGHKPVSTFSFKAVTPHGCGFHPEIEDDKLMAAQLVPYLKTVLNEKK